MNCARQTMTRTSQRLVSPAGGGYDDLVVGALGGDAGHANLQVGSKAPDPRGRSREMAQGTTRRARDPVRPSWRTYVRAWSGGTASGPGAHRARPQRLRGRPPARHPAAHRPRLARPPPLRAVETAGGAGAPRRRCVSRPRTTRNCSACTWVTVTSSSMARAQRLRLMLDAKYPIDRRRGRRADAARRPAEQGRSSDPSRRPHGDVQGTTGTGPACSRSTARARSTSGRSRSSPGSRRSSLRRRGAFLRGCIRSDGCVFINRTGRYEYESYDFANLSAAPARLFAATCALVGVDCRAVREASGSTAGRASR